MAAYSLHHDKSPLGDYLRRMKSKLGPAGATTATAHKIAIIFSRSKSNTTRRFGRSATPSGRNGSKPNSNGRRSNSATSSYRSKKNLPHNRLNLIVRGGVPSLGGGGGGGAKRPRGA